MSAGTQLFRDLLGILSKNLRGLEDLEADLRDLLTHVEKVPPTCPWCHCVLWPMGGRDWLVSVCFSWRRRASSTATAWITTAVQTWSFLSRAVMRRRWLSAWRSGSCAHSAVTWSAAWERSPPTGHELQPTRGPPIRVQTARCLATRTNMAQCLRSSGVRACLKKPAAPSWWFRLQKQLHKNEQKERNNWRRWSCRSTVL